MISKEEYEKWYKSCEFIRKEMRFYSFQDFKENKEIIKFMYQHLNIRTKKLYQWYVFSNPMCYNQKCLIWDFLNNKSEFVHTNNSNSSLEHRTS